jgi:hypothetical protein
VCGTTDISGCPPEAAVALGEHPGVLAVAGVLVSLPATALN